MHANHKEMVPEGAGAPGKSTRPAWKLVQAAIQSGRRMLLALLAAGWVAGLGLMLEGRVTAQTFTALHNFTATDSNGHNSDGANPYAGLTVAGNGSSRYGTAANGGSSGAGTVFAVNADGTGFTNLHSFTWSDGASPWAGLILSGNTLYGTAYHGGSAGYGTVFAINTDGTGFTNLHNFAHGDGANPNAGLILTNNTLYGTASQGGSAGGGAVFAINTDGTGFTILYSFTAGYDGADPVAGLILSGNTLYGTAAYGGSWGNGTVFKVNTDATGFTVLHSFQPTQLFTVCSRGSCPCGYYCADLGFGFPVCVYSFTCVPLPPPLPFPHPHPCAGFCGGG